jgi:hypothetical protein
MNRILLPSGSRYPGFGLLARFRELLIGSRADVIAGRMS